jgi:ABC-type sulfate/molybdate transport systems ATPase subunit
MDVRVEALRFARAGRLVLDIPALAFADGTTTAVFGPNGSGKTTLLRLIGGLERPTAGRVRVGGRPVNGDAVSRRRVGFAFQDERPIRLWEAARECGIAPLLDRDARQLSTGEAQRANLARALALRAPVTLLDEPLSGIDRITRLQLLDDLPRMLGTFASTTILVTHDREEAFRLADHLVVLVDGRVRAAGPKAAVYARPPDPATAELLGYTVVEKNGRRLGVPAGGWTLGGAGESFVLAIERVVDMGHHQHVVGRIGAVRVDVRLRRGDAIPGPGRRVTVVAATHVPVG